MRRRGSKIDANHSAVVRALRLAGASVQSLAELGNGCPDLLISWKHLGKSRTACLEVKDGSLPPSKKRLTPDEEIWHSRWQGELHVVETVEQALELLKS